MGPQTNTNLKNLAHANANAHAPVAELGREGKEVVAKDSDVLGHDDVESGPRRGVQANDEEHRLNIRTTNVSATPLERVRVINFTVKLAVPPDL